MKSPEPLATRCSSTAVEPLLAAAAPRPLNVPLKQGQKALLRISDLDVTEYQTLASLGIPMHVIALNAQSAARPGGQQYVLLHQFHHSRRR